jgi:hypothetical protein
MAVVFNRSAGLLVLAIWLILHGIVAFVPFTMPLVVMPALALIAGVLILIGK